MRFVWFIVLFVIVVAGIVGSASAQELLVRKDVWTGSISITTQEREIHRDRNGIVVVRPVVIQSQTGRAYGVFTNVRRRDANGPAIEQITSGSHRLSYVPHDRLYSHCIDGCQKAEVGVIYLSEQSFRIAARTGLPLQIWGLRGRYDGDVPADAFAMILAQLD